MNYNLTDQLLTDELRKGNLAALEIIYSCYHSVLYKYSFQFLKDIQSTEEAIQEVFIEIWQCRENLPSPIQSLKTYLYVSLRKRLMLQYEQQFVARTNVDQILQILPIDTDTRPIEQNAPPNCYHVSQQEAFLLHSEGFTIEDIAIIMCISKDSVQNLLC